MRAGFESLLPAQWPVFAQMAETAGFESLWFNEEHFQRPHDGRGRFCFSSLIAAAHLAAHTQRIRIGFSVLLLPLHHPVRLAEELATLDVMNGGGSISACPEEAIGTTRRPSRSIPMPGARIFSETSLPCCNAGRPEKFG